MIERDRDDVNGNGIGHRAVCNSDYGSAGLRTGADPTTYVLGAVGTDGYEGVIDRPRGGGAEGDGVISRILGGSDDVGFETYLKIKIKGHD